MESPRWERGPTAGCRAAKSGEMSCGEGDKGEKACAGNRSTGVGYGRLADENHQGWDRAEVFRPHGDRKWATKEKKGRRKRDSSVGRVLRRAF